MKWNCLASVILFISTLTLQAQITKSKITNVDFTVNNNIIYVTYDIENYSPIEKFIVNLTFKNEIGQEFKPISTTGTSNVEVTGGKQKIIVWDVLKDSIELVGNLKAHVYFEKVKQEPHGISSALYSMVVPGLGNRYVVNAKLSTIKPFYITIAAYGFCTYGLMKKNSADKFYQLYKKAEKQEDIELRFNQANNAKHQFIVATCIGASIWLSDIGWVLIKGKQHKKNTRCFKAIPVISSLNQNNKLGVGLKLTF